MRKVKVISVPVSIGTKDDFYATVLERVRSGSSACEYQISLNVSKFLLADKDERLREVISDALIKNADGMPLKWLVWLFKGMHTDRLGGYDYMVDLAKKQPRIRYYLLGARQEVVEKVAEVLKSQYNVEIAGIRNGYFTEKDTDGIIGDINRAKPDVLFIALGTPAKEFFIHKYRSRLAIPFAIGVGGAFDILAGRTKRAPELLQALGLEWFYRFIQEPGRMWKRYLFGNARFIMLVARYVLSRLYSRAKKIISK
jgi:N-acetylglucosaminyldiphosphoundecaprenol N-acetyl-beta-D-mannosaminyltransferase